MAISNRLLQSHRPDDLALPKTKPLWSRFKITAPAKRSLAREQRQFADVVRVFSLLLANGLPVAVAITWLAPRLSGFWGEVFSEIAIKLEHGADLVAELQALASDTPLAEVGEFTQKLIVSIERGTPAAAMVMQLADSLQQQQLRDLIQRAGRNETKMLIPTIFLILPVTVLFAIFPSLLVLQAAYQ